MDADETSTLRYGHIVWSGLLILAFVLGYILGTSPWAERDPSLTAGQSGTSPLLNSHREDPASVTQRASSPEASLPLPTPPGWASSELPISQLGMRNALRAILATDNALHRQLLFPQLLSRMTPDNASGLWEGLTSAPDSKTGRLEMQSMVELLGEVWGQIDGAGAMEFLKEDSPWAKAAGIHALESWARSDPSAAVAWSTSESESRSLDRSRRLSLLRGLTVADLPLATKYFTDLVERTDANAYVEPMITAQLELGVAAAEAWITGISSDAIKQSGLRHIAETLSKEDIHRAAAWVEPFAEEAYGEKAVAAVAQAYIDWSLETEGGVTEVTDWLSDLPEGQAKEAAYGQAIRSWARHQPNAAAEYLGTLPDSPAKNNALRTFAMEVISRDPEAAVHWSNTISDAQLRENTLRITARHWHQADPQAAKLWLQDSGLTRDTLDEILEH